MKDRRARYVTAIACIAACGLVIAGCNGDDDSNSPDQPATFNVAKATCGPNDKPETALQGQVPVALRTVGGFNGFSCNLQLVGQSKGEGASWQHAWFADGAGHKCSYYDTSVNTANRTNIGTVVVDTTVPTNPTPTAYLTSIAMLDPWESLKVNDRRQLLGAINGRGNAGGPEIDLYDIGGNCLQPQLLSSVAVGTGTDGGALSQIPILGHEGEFVPDGLTYWGADVRNRSYYAIDIVDATHPKLLLNWQTSYGQASHGMSFTEDGKTAFFVSQAIRSAANPTGPAVNGLVIADVSDIQARKPNPEVRVISSLLYLDGGWAQMTIPVKIGGKPYVILADENASFGNGAANWQAECANGLPMFPFARIIDISDLANPVTVSKLQLEVHDPDNCSKVMPDLAGLTGFTYGSHYCSVDDKTDATIVACGYFESGIRVFDIRNPARPKELAYYNPASVTTPSPGSQNNRTAANGRPDHCSAQVRIDKALGMIFTTCQDNGFLALRFTNSVWPFR
jgi:hypothetical protein